MDPSQAAAAASVAQQPQVFLEGFLTQYGAFIQAIGFLGWAILGLAAIVFVVFFAILALRVSKACSEYCRWVVAQIGPAPEAEESEAAEGKDAAVDVDKFVE